MAVAFETSLNNMFPEELKPNEQPYTASNDNKLQPKAKKMPVEIDYDELAQHEDKYSWDLPCRLDPYNNSLTMLDQTKNISPANQIGYKRAPDLSIPNLTQTNVSGFDCLIETTAKQRGDREYNSAPPVPVRNNTQI
jgi:hypothetical protein